MLQPYSMYIVYIHTTYVLVAHHPQPKENEQSERNQEQLYTWLTSVVSGDFTIVNPRLPPPTSSRGRADKNSPVSLC